jgi:predicted Fe-Mo cluster-binding NifX family protein
MDNLKVVIACDDEQYLKKNGHFGDAVLYLNYEVAADSERFLKKMFKPDLKEKEHVKGGDPGKAAAMKEFLKGNDILVSRRFGPNFKRLLRDFVCVVVRRETVEDTIALLQCNINRLIDEMRREDRKHIVLGNE